MFFWWNGVELQNWTTAALPNQTSGRQFAVSCSTQETTADQSVNVNQNRLI